MLLLLYIYSTIASALYYLPIRRGQIGGQGISQKTRRSCRLAVLLTFLTFTSEDDKKDIINIFFNTLKYTVFNDG